MNALILLLIIIAWLIAGYFIYAKFLEGKLIKTNDKNKTPAQVIKNNPDYKPGKKFFLFGHHFASIAGAGPIIGPILAVSYFGWFFVVLWIAIGSVFIGAVHDYLSLMFSVRNKGQGIAKISEKRIGKKTFYIFSILLWLTLMLIISVFSVSSAQSLVEIPQLVIPFFGITLIALFLGLAVYKFNQNKYISSIIAFFLVIFFIWLGIQIPISLPFSIQVSQITWISILFTYALVVSLIPIWLVLQPRDYISTLSLFSFLFIGIIAIIITRPEINAPAMIPFSISQIPLWPILFITVACGAVSGFHALISSGTTSKQLAKESHGKIIGYGAMLTEALVAILVLIFVCAGLKWGINITNSLDLNFFQNALSAGWIVAFGRGFANIVSSALPFISYPLLIILGALIVNTFILTSLDTSTRVGRMIASEAINKKSKINKKFLLTLAILIPAFLLAITNTYASLWRMFGSSNQLIAGVVLIAISAYLVEHKKPMIYTLIPSFFMIITTLTALFYILYNNIFKEFNLTITIISSLLIIFAVFVTIEIIIKIIELKKKRKS